jgi:hypothetical protein
MKVGIEFREGARPAILIGLGFFLGGLGMLSAAADTEKTLHTFCTSHGCAMEANRAENSSQIRPAISLVLPAFGENTAVGSFSNTRLEPANTR